MLHITRRQDATSNTLPLRPGPQSHNNNTQRVSERAENERASKRRASIQTTVNRKATPPPNQRQTNKTSPTLSASLAEESSCRTEALREVQPGATMGRKGHPLFQPRHHPTQPPPCLALCVVGLPAAGTRSWSRGAIVRGGEALGPALGFACVLCCTVMLDAPLLRHSRHGRYVDRHEGGGGHVCLQQ